MTRSNSKVEDMHTVDFSFSSKIKRTLSNHQAFRRLVQLGFALFIMFTIIRHLVIGENSSIVTASAEAYCPFGGLETLYKYITAGGSFVSHTHLSNVVIFIAVMVTALLLRSAFCGWICPLGSLQDLVSGIGKSIQKRIPGLRRKIQYFNKKNPWLKTADRLLKYGKYLVLIWAVGGSAYFGYMVFRDYDPWSTLINIVEFSFTPGLIVLILTVVLSLVVERPWCRYACPLGAISGLVGKFSPVYLRREEDACTLCQVCTKACPMGIEIHTAKTIRSVDCISCLECVGACPQKGALEVRVGYTIDRGKGVKHAS
jgi:polyferredoxin